MSGQVYKRNMKKIYHSALQEELSIKNEILMCKNNGDIVRKVDICNGLHKDFESCDVLYSEPAWLDGYQKFMERSNSQSTYKNYLSALCEIIESTSSPIWLVIGKHAHKKLLTPDRIERVKIHNYWTTLLGWNDDNEYSFNTNYDFINQIAERYERTGDFCCGYGNTGKIFKEHGKGFVMSDINGKCIYYIAKELMGYEDSVS